MKPNPALEEFLAPYSNEIQQLTLQLRDFLTDLVPEANELIWDNYNAVAMAYSKSEKLSDGFCHIAVYANHVNFGFNRGSQLPPHTIKLEGSGKLIRHIKVKSMDEFPQDDITKLIWEAVAISEKENPELIKKAVPSKSLVMSISEKKIRPKI